MRYTRGTHMHQKYASITALPQLNLLCPHPPRILALCCNHLLPSINAQNSVFDFANSERNCQDTCRAMCRVFTVHHWQNPILESKTLVNGGSRERGIECLSKQGQLRAVHYRCQPTTIMYSACRSTPSTCWLAPAFPPIPEPSPFKQMLTCAQREICRALPRPVCHKCA